MLSGRTKFIFIILILLANWLLKTQTTSADIFAERLIRGNSLSATTLSFSQHHTASNFQVSGLFNTIGMQPGGFDVKAVRIKKDGKLDFKYHLKAKKTEGDDVVCQNLKIQVLLGGQQKYEGPLLDLSLNSNLTGNNKDDWVFFVGLQSNSAALKNKNCGFNFIFDSFRDRPDENPKGFHAEQSLNNNINNGTWQ